MPVPNQQTDRFLNSESAQKWISLVAKQQGLGNYETKILDLMPQACTSVDVEGKVYYQFQELKYFVFNFAKAFKEQNYAFLSQNRGLIVDRIVDIQEFLESPEFMDLKGHVWPNIMESMVDMFSNENYIEFVLGGATASGKTFRAEIGMAYLVYKLSCYHNPQIEFGLAPGSSIIFIQQSITEKQAKKVVFDQLCARLRRSPYFRKNFPFDPGVKSELRFPKGIYVLPIGGSDTSALGMNVFGGHIDELDFMARTKDSTYVRYTDEEEYDQAERLYSTMIRRIKGRFMQHGKVPGRLFLTSATNYPGDFIHRKIDEAKTDITIYVSSLAQWDALPEDRFGGKKFLVEVGNELKRSQIIRNIDEAGDREDVIEVPIEYKVEFERDIDAALRDLAGVATGMKHPFIPYREEIQEAQDKFAESTGGSQLFLRDSGIIDRIIENPERPMWDLLVNEEYFENCILDPNIVFAAHIDVAKSQDALGLAVGHIAGYLILPSAKYYNQRTEEFVEVTDMRAPMYRIDGALQLIAAPGDEIDLELVRDLVLYLRGRLNLKWVTMDSYQSAMMIQAFRKAKIRSGVLSVDASLAPYTELKLATKDKRILLPPHEVLAREIREVELDSQAKTVDHISNGSKDVSDATAGVVYILQQKEARYGKVSHGGRLRDRGAETQVRKLHVGKRKLGRKRIRMRLG